MLEKLRSIGEQSQVRPRRGDRSLQAVLWTLWTIAVTGTAVWSWYTARMAQQPLHPIGLAIHCLTVGAVGLVVITVIEQRLQPWRFLE